MISTTNLKSAPKIASKNVPGSPFISQFNAGAATPTVAGINFTMFSGQVGVGNLIVLFACINNGQPGFLNIPLGWEEIYRIENSTLRQQAFYKVVEDPNENVVRLTAPANTTTQFRHYEFVGINKQSPVDFAEVVHSNGANVTSLSSLIEGIDVENHIMIAVLSRGSTGTVTISGTDSQNFLNTSGGTNWLANPAASTAASQSSHNSNPEYRLTDKIFRTYSWGTSALAIMGLVTFSAQRGQNIVRINP
jgi:hypothetical protein